MREFGNRSRSLAARKRRFVLVSLANMTMQDHYIDIRTDRGGTLLLMRLADAIAETNVVDGLQIHRSHWVAKNAVQGAVRKEGRTFLKMRDEGCCRSAGPTFWRCARRGSPDNRPARPVSAGPLATLGLKATKRHVGCNGRYSRRA
jgi:hypothetical protein